MLEDIKNKINENAKDIRKGKNNSATAVSGMAKSKVDSEDEDSISRTINKMIR